MKNVCKKLFSLMLVAVMLVSVLPMTAMAADGDVYGNVKLADGTELATIHASTSSTIDEYWKYALELAGEDPNAYEATKRWIRNETTGNGGNSSLSGDYVIEEAGTEMSVIVKHKDVNIWVKVNRDGAESTHKVTYEYGKDLKLNSGLLDLAGVSGDGYDVNYLVGGQVMTGKTITIDHEIEIKVQMLLKDNDKDDDNNDETTAPTEKAIKFTVKDQDGTVKSDSFVPSNGKSASVRDIIAYKSGLGEKWYNSYEFVRYHTEDDGTVEGKDHLDDLISAGEEVTIRLKKISTDTPTTPTEPSTATKTLTIQVKYDGKVYQEVYGTYKQYKDVEIVRDMIREAFDDYDQDDHNITRIEDTKTGERFKLGEKIEMDVNRILKFTLEDRESSKFEGTLYLHVYVDGKITKPYKTYNSDDYSGVRSLISDDKITLKEVTENFLPKYYSAKNTNKGLEVDGLYLNDNFQNKYVDDNHFTSMDVDLSGNKDIHISLMLENVKVKSSSTADSSNPKTGDSIFMTVTVMAVSVTALAVLVLSNKKRMVK